MKLFQALFLAAIIFAASPWILQAQTSPQEVGEKDVVRVTTSLVRVPVSVRDRNGRYVVDLKQTDFQLYENGVEQQIAHFGGVEEAISVVLLIDVSCSIEKPEDTIKAALTFIDQLRPADSVLPIAFGRNIYALLTESTRDHALLRERIKMLPDGKQTRCDGGTRLYDAVDFVIHHILNTGTGRRAVVLLTDGRDSMLSKPGSFVTTLKDVSELGVPFYSIRLVERYRANRGQFTGFPGDSGAERAKLRFFWRDINRYIDDLSSLSGGRSFPAAQGDELRENFIQIGEELRHQYMLAYYPSSKKDSAERRKIKVKIDRSGINVRARNSYLYFPSAK